jgi:hypothetical protein
MSWARPHQPIRALERSRHHTKQRTRPSTVVAERVTRETVGISRVIGAPVGTIRCRIIVVWSL